MKKIRFLPILFFAISCGSSPQNNTVEYGDLKSSIDSSIVLNDTFVIKKEPLKTALSFADSSLVSLLTNFKRVSLPFPNSDTTWTDSFGTDRPWTYAYAKLDRKNERYLQNLLFNNYLIHVTDDSVPQGWGVADLFDHEDTAYFNSWVRDTTEKCFVPGLLLFYNEKFVVITFYDGYEVKAQKNISIQDYIGTRNGILCTIDKQGKFINGITVEYSLGNHYGHISRDFSLSKDLILTIREENQVNDEEGTGYNLRKQYKILSDGTIKELSRVVSN